MVWIDHDIAGQLDREHTVEKHAEDLQGRASIKDYTDYLSVILVSITT